MRLHRQHQAIDSEFHSVREGSLAHTVIEVPSVRMAHVLKDRVDECSRDTKPTRHRDIVSNDELRVGNRG